MQSEEIILLLFLITFVFGMSWTPIGRNLAERLRGKPRADPEDLAALREELLSALQQTRQEVSDLNERLDFAERMLAKRDAERLPPGQRA